VSAVFFQQGDSRRKIIKRNKAYHTLHKYVSKCFWHFINFPYNAHHECVQGLAIDTPCSFEHAHLKGLSHEIDFKNFDKKLHTLA
jgi:hypothetical protein